MKYPVIAIKDHVQIIPATEMIFTSLVTGEEVGKRLPIPATEIKTVKGQRYTARNKPEMLKLVQSASGNK